MCVLHMPGRQMSNGEGRESPSQYTHREEQVKGSCDPRVYHQGTDERVRPEQGDC